MSNIVHIISGLTDGGAEAVLYRLCYQNKDDTHHVISLTGMGKYGDRLVEAGIEVTCLRLPRGKMTFRAIARLWRSIRKSRPDVVQCWMYHADLLGGLTARLAGVGNVVWGIHHSNSDMAQSSRKTILVARICARLSGLIPRRIICCAVKARQVHVDLGYDLKRMRVIPNGYDLSVFKPDLDAGLAVRVELGIDPRSCVLGFVARLDAQKDHENLLSALSLLNAQGVRPACILVGSGLVPENVTLTRRIAELGLDGQIYLLGWREDIPSIMNALDFHVMSSAFGEAFPNVLAEALACGTPCVSTDVGDAAVILGETGIVVPPRNPKALAAVISEMMALRESSDWGQRKQYARDRVADNFSIERMVKSYREVWFDGSG